MIEPDGQFQSIINKKQKKVNSGVVSKSLQNDGRMAQLDVVLAISGDTKAKCPKT